MSCTFVENQWDARVLSRTAGNKLTYVYLDTAEQSREAKAARRRYLYEQLRV